MAQWQLQETVNLPPSGFIGSSPIAPTTLSGRVVMVAEMVLEAIAYACGFESLRPHHFKINIIMKTLALLIISLTMTGCYASPVIRGPRVIVVDPHPRVIIVEPAPRVIVTREYPRYPSVSWHIDVNFGRGHGHGHVYGPIRGHSNPGIWRHYRHW